MSNHVVRTSRGPRCQSSKGKFVKNSKCGLALGSISSHLSSTLAGAPEICVSTGKGEKCTAVRSGSVSRTYKLKSGASLTVANRPFESRQKGAAKNFGTAKAKAARKRFKDASDECTGVKNRACCMSKILGDGKAPACKGGGGKKQSGGSKKTSTGRTAKQRSYTAKQKRCKGAKNYAACMKKK